MIETHPTELVNISDLRPHHRNYRHHPPEQLKHLVASLLQHGFYRHVVIAQDNTILAGHGLVQAAQLGGVQQVPVLRLPVSPDSPAALKVLASDNELGRFAETDDRALTELLKEVMTDDVEGLLGTGFDDQMLAGLVMVTRPAAEIQDFDAAAEWVGMPEYTPSGGQQLKLTITFLSAADREEFTRLHALRIDKRESINWSTRWPFTVREDVAGLHFKGGK